MHPSKVATAQEGLPAWTDISPLECLRDSPALKRYMFRWFFKDNDDVVCTPAGQPVPAGSCRCSTHPTCPSNHFCPATMTNPEWVNHIPDVRQEATKVWWAKLASHACSHGFEDINFSLAFRSASLDWPAYGNLQEVMSRVRAVACGADTSFGVEDLRRAPDGAPPLVSIGERFLKRIDKTQKLSTCGGTYAACGCSQFDSDPGQAGDLCIPRERFETPGFPASYGSPYVELDGDSRWRFFTAPYEVRRRFLLHSLRSARATYGNGVPTFFEVPMVLPVPAASFTEQLGPFGDPIGWSLTWNDPEDTPDAGAMPVCPTPTWPGGAPFPVHGVADLWSCGHGDLFPASW